MRTFQRSTVIIARGQTIRLLHVGVAVYTGAQRPDTLTGWTMPRKKQFKRPKGRTRRIVGKYENLAYDRAEYDHETAQDRGFYFDEKEAQRAVDFYGLLTHYKGEWAGTSFTLEPWQEFIVREVFGWKRQEDGFRRFRYVYKEVPRKNGKSFWAAGTGLKLMIGDNEPGAEVYSSATKKDQARIIWNDAKQMVRLSPYLKRYIDIFAWNLSSERNASKFEPLSADAGTLDGLNPHGSIVDELHAHKDREVWDVLETAKGARRQPLTVAVTTAGLYAENSIGYEEHRRAQNILDGVFEADDVFAFIAAADKDDDWADPKIWKKANPNLGVSINPAYMRSQISRAKETPTQVNTVRRLHLDIWVTALETWLDPDQWALGDLTVEPSELRGVRGYAGLDLATVNDIAAFVLVFPDSDGTLDVICKFWVPEDRIYERSIRDRVPYDMWVEQGFLTTTPGNVIDHDVIIRDIIALSKQYRFQEIGFDRWGSDHVVKKLTDWGLEVIEVGQGFASMSEPTKQLERLVLGHKIAQGANPVLKWMASNVVIEEDAAGNKKPNKKKSADKIDGVVALIMAIERVMSNADSYYPDRGLLTV